MTAGEKAWVTLATNDSYALGAVVLGNSLKRVNANGKLVVMITPGVSSPMRNVLESTFDVVTDVNVLDSEDAANLALLTRPELGITFTKLHCWRLTQYEKCVFLDADTLVLQNCDELFSREEFSAAPDSGWPDCFNSGVFVFQPSLDTYQQLLQFAIEKGSFDGGDQGLLNSYFSDWSTADIGRHLPFTYNMVATATYSYLPAYRVFGHNVKIAHFIGPSKPWMQFFDSATGRVQPESGQEHLQELLQAWWDIFRTDVHPKLTPQMGGESATEVEQKGLAGAYAQMSFVGTKSHEQLQYEDAMRKNAWEQGRMDYLGADSFDNIMKKIQASLEQAAATSPPKTRGKSPSPPKTAPKSRATPTTSPVPEPIPLTQTPAPVEATQQQQQPESQSAGTEKPVTVQPTTATTTPAAEQKIEEEKKQATPPPSSQTTTTPVPDPQVSQQQPESPKPEPIISPPVTLVTVPEVVAAPQPEPTKAAEVVVVTPTVPEKVETKQEPLARPTGKSAPSSKKQKSKTPPPQQQQQQPAAKSADDLEEERLARERQVVEKKLAEQKLVAEQKLQEEKQRAAATAASKGQQKTKVPPPQQQQQQSSQTKPQAPPRGKGKGKK